MQLIVRPVALFDPARAQAAAQGFRRNAPGLSRTRRSACASLLLSVCLACSSGASSGKSADDLEDPGAARYRLPLRHNAVDPGAAFRCYGQCQAQTSPVGYLQCLAQCPGFEITQGVRCADEDVPPISACFTVRQIPKQSEPSAGWVVLAVVANVALIVGLASVCASSSSQCGYGYYPPGPLPY
jgi:hypothetical protein